MADYRDLGGYKSPTHNATVYGYTDVDKYVDWSTYIDFTHGYVDNTHQGTLCNYTLRLQYWNGSAWTNVSTKTGSFQYSVTTRFYMLTLQAGSYRMNGVYTFNGKSYSNFTPAFIVER